ncbi:MAG: DUF6644 family protein [Caulobacteraceae bacterium]
MALSLHDFAHWLADTPLSLTIQNVSWIIPTVQTIHILSIALVISSVFMMDLRLLGVIGRGQPTAAYVHRFLPLIWWTLIVLLISGSILIIGEPARSLMNPAFQFKMCMLILAIIVTLTLHRPVGRDPAYWELTPGRVQTGKIIAVVSMLVWVSIIFAGRWIAYMNTTGD